MIGYHNCWSAGLRNSRLDTSPFPHFFLFGLFFFSFPRGMSDDEGRARGLFFSLGAPSNKVRKNKEIKNE